MVGEVLTPSFGDRGRRLAAVWFCDVVGSTEIAAELGDRRFRWLIGRYLAVARSALRRHGGREIDTAGDGMFAVFDAPATALRAAFEATAAVRDFGLEIRSGVHLGEVEQDADHRVGGIAVHIGARVASIAEPGAVLTTATTSELASGGGFRFEDRGTHVLKGIAGHQAVVAVVEVDGQQAQPTLEPDEAARRRAATTEEASLPAEGASGDATSGERGRPFVGRTRELDEVLSALPAASAGHGSLFLISGEPGIGKSRLMSTVAEHAEERGWRVLTGRCWRAGALRPTGRGSRSSGEPAASSPSSRPFRKRPVVDRSEGVVRQCRSRSTPRPIGSSSSTRSGGSWRIRHVTGPLSSCSTTFMPPTSRRCCSCGSWRPQSRSTRSLPWARTGRASSGSASWPTCSAIWPGWVDGSRCGDSAPPRSPGTSRSRPGTSPRTR